MKKKPPDTQSSNAKGIQMRATNGSSSAENVLRSARVMSETSGYCSGYIPRVISWPPDLTELLLLETAGVRTTRVAGAGILNSAPARSWMHSLMSSGTRNFDGTMPSLMSAGLLFTLRDDFDTAQWLGLEDRESGVVYEGSERCQRALSDVQTSGIGITRRTTGLLSSDDSERFASMMPRLNALWLLVACGYMVPFTSIGSLIAYFNYTYGPKFYVKLYCAFYLPGWPISELQRRFDESFDRKFGSCNTFLARVGIGLAIQGAVLLLLTALPPWAHGDLDIEKVVTIALMVLLGSASWFCHGTACQLCGLFPPTSVAFLQTGFRTPEVYSVVMVATLALDARATQAHVAMYYWCTALLVCVGGFAWIALVRSPPARHYFELKDLAQASENHPRGIRSPHVSPDSRRRLPPRTHFESNNCSSSSSSNRETTPLKSSLKNSLFNDRQQYSAVPSETPATWEKPTMLASTVKEVPHGDPMLAVSKAVFNCRLALFLNIWSSIFVGAFFAYCPTDRMPLLGVLGGPKFDDISVVLYFTRLFSDLIGRPFSGMLCPNFLSTEGTLVPACVLRLLLAVAFFVYIWPTQPLPPSNIFVLTVISIFSALSGILCVRSYEIAAAKMSTKIDQARAVSLMNTTFQAACFSAVVMGVAISETGFFKGSINSLA